MIDGKLLYIWYNILAYNTNFIKKKLKYANLLCELVDSLHIDLSIIYFYFKLLKNLFKMTRNNLILALLKLCLTI